MVLLYTLQRAFPGHSAMWIAGKHQYFLKERQLRLLTLVTLLSFETQFAL